MLPPPGAFLPTTMHGSLVVNKLATLLTSTSAVRTAFSGSTIAALIMSTHSTFVRFVSVYVAATVSDREFCVIEGAKNLAYVQQKYQYPSLNYPPFIPLNFGLEGLTLYPPG
jgi:hypothetical protein